MCGLVLKKYIETVAVDTRTFNMTNVDKVKEFINKVQNSKIHFHEIPITKTRSEFQFSSTKFYLILTTFFFIVILWLNRDLLSSRRCSILMPSLLSHAFRKPENCNFCRNVTEIVHISNILPDEFERDFAYNSRPVIITDATTNWTAQQVFNFWYFKEVYSKIAEDSDEEWNCQFFPYKTEFKSLEEALNIPKERVNYVAGNRPWYFGWSNCNHEVAQNLRQHYGRPYFLPKTSENAAIDWIFIGGTGLGAHMHVDNVRLPSWQAQIKGTKKWTLAPPPECYFECASFSATVQTGDISKLRL